MGRPRGYKVTDTPKDNTFKFRYDNRTMEMLDTVSEKTATSKAEVIRKGIEIQYDRLDKSN